MLFKHVNDPQLHISSVSHAKIPVLKDALHPSREQTSAKLEESWYEFSQAYWHERGYGHFRKPGYSRNGKHTHIPKHKAKLGYKNL